MTKEDVLKAIDASCKALENYRSFGSQVSDGIDALTKIKENITKATPESIAETREMAAEMSNQIGPYRGFIPVVTECLEKIHEWVDAQ